MQRRAGLAHAIKATNILIGEAHAYPSNIQMDRESACMPKKPQMMPWLMKMSTHVALTTQIPKEYTIKFKKKIKQFFLSCFLSFLLLGGK